VAARSVGCSAVPSGTIGDAHASDTIVRGKTMRSRQGAEGPALLGPLERRVMQQLWEHGPRTVAQVVDGLNAGAERKLAYTTVMTILARLYEKGFTSRRIVRRSYTYGASVDERTLADAIGRRELSRLIARYGATQLARFAEDLSGPRSDLTERLRELSKLELNDHD
jgi:predicted transcriptional regulator